MTYSEFKKLSKAQQLYAIESGEAVMSEPRPMNPAWLRLEGQEHAEDFRCGMPSELPKLPAAFLVSELEAILPAYKDSFSITHNPHKLGELAIHDWLLVCYPRVEFEDDLAESKVIETGELWVAHYYPPGTGALISLGAPTLAGLLEQLNFWATDGN